MSASAQRFAGPVKTGRPGGHGLVGIERPIMDLHDEGLETAAIAAALNLSPRSVQKIVSTFRIDGAGDRLAREAAAAGSAQLLAAQLRAGQHCLSPAMATALRAAIGTGA